ncbi:hypothetical protein, partial [Rhodococcus aetherivorans]
RPALDLLPEPVAKLLTEYDTATVRLRETERELQRLAARERDQEAAEEDAQAAATAVRAGKKVPAPLAARKLEQDRAEIARTLDAHRAVLTAIESDLSEARDNGPDTATLDRQEIDSAAEALIAALEREVAAQAAVDWMRGAPYSPHPVTWAVDVVPGLGLPRNVSPKVDARRLIESLVAALLDGQGGA